jgi:two-component system, OmpR family, KDP operon response regulator KdpE
LVISHRSRADAVFGHRWRVLVIGGDKASSAFVSALAGNGLDCVTASREQGPARLLDTSPQLVLIEFPGVDHGSLAFCGNLRSMYNIPVVIYSASGREGDIVRALQAGADDYFVLPMPPAELRARLIAILKRSGDRVPDRAGEREIRAGDLTISLDERRVYRRGQAIDLSPTEFRLLLALAQQNGRPVSHSQLLFSVWGPQCVDSRHYLRLYVRYLRSKLEDNPEDPKIIVNEWGIGYRFLAKSA